MPNPPGNVAPANYTYSPNVAAKYLAVSRKAGSYSAHTWYPGDSTGDTVKVVSVDVIDNELVVDGGNWLAVTAAVQVLPPQVGIKIKLGAVPLGLVMVLTLRVNPLRLFLTVSPMSRRETGTSTPAARQRLQRSHSLRQFLIPK